MSALTIDSGAYQLVTPRPRGRRDDPLQPSPWLSAGALALTGVGMILGATILVILYAFVAHQLQITPRSLLLIMAAVLLGLAGVLEIAAWTVRIIGHRQRIETTMVLREVQAATTTGVNAINGLDAGGMAKLQQELARCRAELRAMPEDAQQQAARRDAGTVAVVQELQRTVGEVADQVRAGRSEATTTAEQLGSRMGGLERTVTEEIAEIRQQVAAIERQVDEQDEEYERGWVEGAHRTAEALAPGNGNGHGQVRQLRPSSAPPRRPGR